MATSENLTASTADTVNAVVWTAASFSVVFVALRLYVRVFLKGAFGIDDAIVLVATMLLVAYASVCTAATKVGLGRHIDYVAQNPENIIQVALLADIGEAVAIMACTLGKTSFALTLLRIVVHDWMKMVLWFIMITMNIVNILAAIFVFAQCKDPRHLWNAAIPSECWPTQVFTRFSLFVGAYSGAQDFVLALLPWSMMWNLQMGKKEKICIAAAMSLGVFAGATAIVKTTYLVALSEKSDFTWALAPLLWWAAAEDGLAIVASSIPLLRPLLRKVFPDPKSSQGSNPYSRSYALSDRANMFVLKTKGYIHTTVEAGQGDGFADDQSDRSILRQPGNESTSTSDDHKQTDIKRTTKVDITYTKGV